MESRLTVPPSSVSRNLLKNPQIFEEEEGQRSAAQFSPRGGNGAERISPRRRPVGQVVKTRPFHGCNMGSNPVRVTTL